MAPKTKPSAALETQKESQAPATSTTNSNGVLTNDVQAPGGQAVNKKKQKRRQKEALRAASQQHHQDTPTDNPPLNGHAPPSQPPSLPPPAQYEDPNFSANQYDRYAEEEAYSDEDGHYDYDPAYLPPNGLDMSNGTVKKKKAKHNLPLDQVYARPPPPHPTTTEAIHSLSRPKYEKIWETNSNEERKRIKQFWLDLPEDKRRSLVNIEKRHVLDKMKEQQKHSCSCTVCGRKRTAIEEELEVLLRDPRIWADPTHINTSRPPLPSHQPSRSRITELADDDDEDAELDDEEDDEDYSEDDYDDYSDDIANAAPPGSADFFRFGSDLRIKDGILTVADDLLQNDGQKFIDMMEMLAEKRIRREQDALDAHAANGHNHRYPPHRHDVLPHTHSHADQNLPPEEDEEYDDDEEEYSDDEYDEEEDEMDAMTEEQRMQEGRRMFQIFAARMFEQRVVQAYKERVAEERQQALIADEESKGNEGSSEAKRAKAAEKKKRQREKARELKAAKDAAKEEDRLRKEAATREAEEKKKEEQRQKQEEARKRKEAEREALAEKKRRKDAEAQKRIEAERERQVEQERKVREQKAEEKRKRDEAERQKRDEKEAKDKELREKKAHAEKQQQQEREARDRTVKLKSKDEPGAEPPAPHILKRPSVPAGVALPPSLKSRPSYSESPQIKVATPALPKAPTPAKSREASSQQISSPHTPERTPQSKQSLSPRSNTSQTNHPSNLPALRTSGQPFVFNQPSASQSATMSPMRPIHPPPGMQHPGIGIGGLHTMGGYSGPQRPSNLFGSPVQAMPMHPQMYPQQRQYMPNAPLGMMPPGMQQHQTPQMAPGFGGTFGHQAPMTGHIGNAQPIGQARDMPPHSHSRQPSAQLDSSSNETPLSATAPAPISRPAPIKRPASVKPGQTTNADIDELSNHLGSSALLGDGDEPLPMGENRRPSAAPGMPTSASLAGMHKPFDQMSTPFSRGPSNDSWGRPPFGPPGISGQSGWSQQSSGWSGYQSTPQPSRSVGSRAVKVRTYTVQSCRYLVNSNRSDADGWIDYNEVIDRTQASARQLHLEPPVQVGEIKEILETLGDHNNGGGSFQMALDSKGRKRLKWIDDRLGPNHAQPNAPGPRGLGLGGLGDIGSPRTQPLLPSLGSMRDPRY